MRSARLLSGDGLWLYFILTFALSWAAWLTGILAGMTNTTFPGALLFILGGSGPSIIGVVLLYRYALPAERKDFWKRVVNFRAIRPAWYALILLGTPVIMLLSLLVDALSGGSQSGYAMLAQIAAQPLMILPALIGFLIGGPLSEELGWRGFALDRMTRRWGLLRASLLLGVIWWAWHLPLFWFQGTTHYQWGLGTPLFWIFLLTVFPLSVFISWAYACNQRSILAAILIHLMFNFTLGLVFPVSVGVQLLSGILHLLLAAGLVIFTRQPQWKPAPGIS